MAKNKSSKDDCTVEQKKAKLEELKREDEKQIPFPELYTIPPTQPAEKKIGQLSEAQLKQFFDKGYVLVEDFFTPERLDVVREAVNDLVGKMANALYHAGKIKNKHEDKGFSNRLTFLEKEFKGASVLMHKQGILPKAFQDLWSDEQLLNVAEQIIGPDIAGHPVWNLRTKVAAGGHRKGKTAKHTCCAGGTWYVQLDEEEMVKDLGVDMKKDVETCQVPYGGVLFLNNAVPHQSLENFSDIIRWSLDLRWQTPYKDNGFYGLKNSVLMRTSKDPNYKIDWTEMAGINRSKLQMDVMEEDDFDFTTEIGGPWMKRWEIVHHNRHTESLNLEETSWHKA